jgi:hypothetical protein
MPSPFPDNGDEIETAQGATSHEHDSRVSSTACGTGHLEPNP